MGDEAEPRKYLRVASAVRRQVETGKLLPGEHVPTLASLATEFGCSTITCGKALRLLESEDLLIRYPGLGYFVRPAR